MHGFAIAFELGPVFYVGGVRSFLSMKIKGSRGRSVRSPVGLTESDLRGFSNKSLRSSPWCCALDRRVLAWFFSIDRGMLERSLCVRWSALKEVEDGFFRGQNFFDFFFRDHHPGGPPKRCMACTLFIARDKNSSALIGLPLWKNHQATRNPTPAPMR